MGDSELREAIAAERSKVLSIVMDLVRKRYWEWRTNGASTQKSRAADDILGDIIETFDEASALSSAVFFASTDPSVNPVVAALLDKEGATES